MRCFLFDCRKFVFPSMTGDKTKRLTASFQHIKKLFEIEFTMPVKLAHKLNHRVIHPSNIERQSFQLTHAVFHESTINALKFYGRRGHPDFLETAEFLIIVSNWWKTVNVKSKFSALRKRDKLQEVITSENLIERTCDLRGFVDWLQEWKETSHEGLTVDTWNALQQTTEGLASLSEYLINHKHQQYVLLGKFQSDWIEGRFGKLCQMNGGNLFASVRQFLESERTLKIKNLAMMDLKLSEIKDLFSESEEQHSSEIENSVKKILSGLKIERTVSIPTALPDSVENILFYVGGYFSRSLKKLAECQSCKEILVSSADQSISVICEKDPSLSHDENDQQIALITEVNRGGLIFPSEFIFTACVIAWDFYQKICQNSEVVQVLFQPNISSQKVFSSAFMQYLGCDENTRESFLNFVCEFGHSQQKPLIHLSKKFFNVVSKNFVSEKNSELHSAKKRNSDEEKRLPGNFKIQKLQSTFV